MLHLTPTPLIGPRYQLTPLAEGDLEPLVDAALSAKEIFRLMPYRIETADDVKGLLALAMHRQREGPGVTYVTRKGSEIVGSTTLFLTDAVHHRVEIGATWILPKHQRTAANTEAKWLQLRHCFEQLDALRVELKTDARNERSQAAMLRIGAVQEGVLRAHMFRWNGEVRDSMYFSITRSDWPRVKSHLDGLMAAFGRAPEVC
jgi:RimJ/RimL family protein N-acetyltransferase